jgi:ribonucleases P/MRP protein subunit RPP40
MVQGKKRFERLIWACKNVLTSPLTWLFYDLRDTDPMEGKFLLAHLFADLLS